MDIVYQEKSKQRENKLFIFLQLLIYFHKSNSAKNKLILVIKLSILFLVLIVIIR